MKNLIALIAFLTVFSSCSKEIVVIDNSGYFGKWTLVKMSGSKPNSETTGTAMEWQEFYLLNTNGTFTKSRAINGVKTTISGIYTTTNHSDGIYFELTYPNDSEIIGSCYGNLKEELYSTATNTLSSTWKNCDGPGLEYKK
ncbi:hypothetical protein H4V97_000361 [Flavobacterium sp. CG_23.5]|uniref:hypothetical protein n=1 Tax=unclassified Flavobacterium TaxID=196869 RepID=UPI0018C8F6F4|nr:MULTISPECIES: hypothetical protein [unclassified Flavobacterium]MBG6111970.1 hypothetical protein [Flavobacterium sp. CG_9.10]MBP2282043.1 hypothetical protein [Flavobacterium sp. CG_23.5]